MVSSFEVDDDTDDSVGTEQRKKGKRKKKKKRLYTLLHHAIIDTIRSRTKMELEESHSKADLSKQILNSLVFCSQHWYFGTCPWGGGGGGGMLAVKKNVSVSILLLACNAYGVLWVLFCLLVSTRSDLVQQELPLASEPWVQNMSSKLHKAFHFSPYWYRDYIFYQCKMNIYPHLQTLLSPLLSVTTDQNQKSFSPGLSPTSSSENWSLSLFLSAFHLPNCTEYTE